MHGDGAGTMFRRRCLCGKGEMRKGNSGERFGGAQFYLKSGAARVNRLWKGLYRVTGNYANAVWKYPYAKA
jgi:hypothetical protein